MISAPLRGTRLQRRIDNTMDIRATLFVGTAPDGSDLSFCVRRDDAWVIARNGMRIESGPPGGDGTDEAVVHFLSMCARQRADRRIPKTRPKLAVTPDADAPPSTSAAGGSPSC
jgi:hypothetical protein